MKVTIYQDAEGRWRWRLQSANGRVLADSGRAWVMSPVEGEDANDMYRRAGVRAVAELMRSAM